MSLKQFIDRPHSVRLRKQLFAIHQWIGIVLCLYFAIISITGVILLFKEQLEELLSANNYTIERTTSLKSSARSPEALTLSLINKELQFSHPGFQISGVVVPPSSRRPLIVYAINSKGSYTALSVDPDTEKILGPYEENGVLKFVQDLHFDLLLKRPGRIFNSLGGLFLCIITLTGLVLWWKGRQNWTKGFNLNLFGKPNVIAWDLHHLLGIITVPSLLVWGATGVYFGFRPEFENVIRTAFPLKFQSPAPTSVAPIGQHIDRDLLLDSLASSANRVCPDRTVARIAPPLGRNSVAKVWMRERDSAGKGDIEVDIDASTGAVISVGNAAQKSVADGVIMWLNQLHFGDFGGLPITLVWTLTGISPLILSVTGLMMYFRRMRLKKRKSAEHLFTSPITELYSHRK